MNLKVGDKVRVICGKDNGKEGKIIAKKGDRVLVEGINMVKKHVKGNGQQAGSITEMEAPIHASNVMIVDPKTKKPTRIGHSINKDGKKIRVTKKSNSSLD
jgi:large subunit ribosomal protein L24